jgi:hypothetical protein
LIHLCRVKKRTKSPRSDDAIVREKIKKINIDNKIWGCYRDGRWLSALIHNYGDVLVAIFFHRRGAKDAKGGYFLFAFLSKANEKKSSLCDLCASAVRFLSEVKSKFL